MRLPTLHRRRENVRREAGRPALEPLEDRRLCAVDVTPFDIGAATLANLWVDPVHGNDRNSGATRDQALRSLGAAWNLVPQGQPLASTGYQILLIAGDYSADLLPANGWTSDRHGMFACPVILKAVDSPLTARLRSQAVLVGKPSVAPDPC
jgi:hypothetical protein